MTVTSGYPGVYPLPGDVILLCEGDLIGYETALLRRWTAERLRTTPLVDVLACGTASAAWGMSDALGRSRPVMVIEDRDFRTVEEATSDCQRHKSDREDREVTVAGWKAWCRNEIENYFLELEVLLPVMAEWFACPEDHVRDILADLLPSLAVFQATEYALYRARRQWTEGDPAGILRNSLRHRPSWTDKTCTLTERNPDEILAKLRENIERWQHLVLHDGEFLEPFNGKQIVEDCNEKFEAWKAMRLDDPVWQVDWAGKEVLHWLRIAMTARYGWPEPNTGTRKKLRWEGVKRRDREAQDRVFERAMRKDMDAGLLEYLRRDERNGVRDEWIQITDTLRSAAIQGSPSHGPARGR